MEVYMKYPDNADLIVAYSKNRVIGRDGLIPWNIEGEKKRFKELTTGNIVVMGRRTYEEIGRPLPNRLNIVLSNTKNFSGGNLITMKILMKCLKDLRMIAEGYILLVAKGYIGKLLILLKICI